MDLNSPLLSAIISAIVSFLSILCRSNLFILNFIMSILKNLTKVKNDLGREIKLVVVTKNRSVREINQNGFFLEFLERGYCLKKILKT